jgi:cytochrome c556
VVTLGLVALVSAACTTGKGMAGGSGDVVMDRQRLMKLHGGLWKDIQDKHKAGNLEGIAVSAEALALNAPRIPALFPEGSMTEKSKAKPEIWQKFPDFEKAAMGMKTESERLRDAAQKKDQAAVDAQMKEFGKKACGACHTPFRVPPKA